MAVRSRGGDLHLHARKDPADVALGDLRLELQGIGHHHHRHRLARADVLAERHQSAGDDAADGRGDGRVPHLLLREGEGGAPTLGQGVGRAGALEGLLVGGLRHPQPRPERVHFAHGQEVAAEQLLASLEIAPRLLEVGARPPDVGLGLGVEGVQGGLVDSQPGEALEVFALGAGGLQPKLGAVESHDRRAHAHLVAEVGDDLHDAAVHLRGDRDLLHARQGTGHLDHALDRLRTQLLGADDHGAAGARGVRTASRAGRDEQAEGDRREKPSHPLLHRPRRRSSRAREIERSRALCTRSARALASCDWASANSRALPSPVW